MRYFNLPMYLLGFMLSFFWLSLIQRHMDNVQAIDEIFHEFRRVHDTFTSIGTPWGWIDSIKALGHDVDKQWIAEYERKRHRGMTD